MCHELNRRGAPAGPTVTGDSARPRWFRSPLSLTTAQRRDTPWCCRCGVCCRRNAVLGAVQGPE